MTEEEMAKKYEEKAEYIEVDDNGHKRYGSIDIEQAFLAGLKADRPQWHILAETPDILPKEGQEVKVLTEEGVIEKSTYFYDTYFEEMGWSNIGLQKVYAWCEIPTFDKE